MGLFPSLCLLCDAPSQRATSLCRGCEADLPWIRAGCRSCGLPLPDDADQLHCGECLATTSPFTVAIIPFLYEAPSSHLITRFKYHQHLLAGNTLGDLLARELRDHYLLCGGNRHHTAELMPELILPVPLHWTRWLWRGYNQSQLLAQQVSQSLGIPVNNRMLKRIRRTPSQQGLSRAARLKNLQHAFLLQEPLEVKRVALLDDVVTTGATTIEIARLLKQHGAAEVHLWALARTLMR